MKKFILSGIVLAAFLSTNVFAANVIVNDEKIDTQAIIVDSRTLVPVRGVFEKLNFDVKWDNEKKTAVLTNGKTTISITNGEKTFTVDGKNIIPDVPQQIIEGRFYLPLRAIVEVLPDYNVEWNNSEKAVYIAQSEDYSYSENDAVNTKERNDISKIGISNNNSEEDNVEVNPEIVKIIVDDNTVYKNDYIGLTIYTNNFADRIKILSNFKSDEIIFDNFVETNAQREFKGKIKMTKIGECEFDIYPGNKKGYKNIGKTVNVIVEEQDDLSDEISGENNSENSNGNYFTKGLDPDTVPISQLEMEVFALVNKERTDKGLAELEWSYELAAVARAHSADMAKNNYFSHDSLNGESFSDRRSAAGIPLNGYGAENIAAGSKTAEAVMNQWMNSDGHKRNILNPNLKKLGVGLAVSSNSEYGYYWTQCFTG